MQIVLNVLPGVFKEYPGPDGQGKTFIFTEDLELVSINGNAQPAHTPGGTHSGLVTKVRELTATDTFFPNDEVLAQYQATYLFDTATANLPAALPRGLITAHGVFRFPKPATIAFAITGGTGPYKLARGQVTESGPGRNTRTLDITL
jgi:hypothetical protein